MAPQSLPFWTFIAVAVSSSGRHPVLTVLWSGICFCPMAVCTDVCVAARLNDRYYCVCTWTMLLCLEKGLTVRSAHCLLESLKCCPKFWEGLVVCSCSLPTPPLGDLFSCLSCVLRKQKFQSHPFGQSFSVGIIIGGYHFLCVIVSETLIGQVA